MDRPRDVRDGTQNDYKQPPPEASKPSIDVGQVIVVRSSEFLIGCSRLLTLIGKHCRGIRPRLFRQSSCKSPPTQSKAAAVHRYRWIYRSVSPSRYCHPYLVSDTIGSALFVAIGSGVSSGPLCLLIGFLFWATVVFSVAQCQIEIVTLFPLDGSYIRLAGRMVDPALGVVAGWNLFFSQTSYVIFEATIINTLVSYWGYDQSPAILISVSLVLYLALNVYRADLFGEAEFWLALGKILLATGLILYTFVVMLGGNPLHE
jgi:hypothetical protein